MKAMVRLTLAVVLLAGAVSLPTTVAAAPPSACEQFCWTVFCAGDQICGPYINSNGQLACGCHGPKIILG
jgi:hypothetical protein